MRNIHCGDGKCDDVASPFERIGPKGGCPRCLLAVAIAFAVGRFVTFANAVLAGFQRYGTINAITIAALLLRFSGFAMLLVLHCSLASDQDLVHRRGAC